MPTGVGANEYHDRTKHHPDDAWDELDLENRPTDHKRYIDQPHLPFDGRVSPPAVPTLAAIADVNTDFEHALTQPSVDAVDLRTVCYYAAGVTQATEYHGNEKHFRAASCTGALYHVDLYPVVGEDGPLEAGVYHFDPMTLQLDVLREGDHRDVLVSASGDPRIRMAPVTFVITSEWWRNAWKYTERTYRHAFWDSGTVLANLLAVAAGMDVPAGVTMGFADDRVADLIGVDTQSEAPLELVPFGAAGSSSETAMGRSSSPAERDTAATDSRQLSAINPEEKRLSPNPKRFDLIHAAYVASGLSSGDAATDWRQAARTGGVGVRDPEGTQSSDGEGDTDWVELAPVSDARASKTRLRVAIQRRRSHREFDTDAAVNFRKLSTILDRAIRPIPMDVLTGERRLALNEPYLIVNRVENLRPGAYRYHPDAGALQRLRAGSFSAAATHLALNQAWGGQAAVQVYFLTDLDAVLDRFGDRGYRCAQLEAGIAMGRLYLATYAHSDLAGTGLTFFDDEVTDFFEPHADNRTPTCLYVLGPPE